MYYRLFHSTKHKVMYPLSFLFFHERRFPYMYNRQLTIVKVGETLAAEKFENTLVVLIDVCL